jgi:peptidoglycan/LPS O-acetylase OafA/YrhL
MWACGALVASLWGAQVERRTVLNWRPLSFLGRISYSIYLVHYPIALILYEKGPAYFRFDSGGRILVPNLVVYALCCTLATLVCGMVLYQLVEKRSYDLVARLRSSLGVSKGR